MGEPNLQAATLELLNRARQLSPTPLEVIYRNQKVGYILPDQGQQYLSGGGWCFDISDLTAPDFTLSHQLLNYLMLLEKQVPQISFNLTTNDLQLDAKLMASGMALYQTVLNTTIYQQQADIGILTEEIKEAYFKGVLAQLPPESEQGNQLASLRMATLLDALVFFKDEEPAVMAKFQELYPNAFEQAELMYQMLQQKPVTTPIQIRRGIVRLYRMFDKCLRDLQFQSLRLSEFVTVSLVLTENQTMTKMKNLFEIYHTEWQDNLQFKSAYIGRLKTDQQNSFVINAPEQVEQEYFKNLYDMPVAVFLRQQGCEYFVRTKD